MKVIDLLNKIANGEQVPNKIKYKNFIYEYWKEETVIDYRCYDEKTDLYGYLSSCVDYETFNILNNEIEIIEEDNMIKRIKELNYVGNCKDIGEFKDKQHLNNHILKDKINEVIDEINKLKENNNG